MVSHFGRIAGPNHSLLVAVPREFWTWEKAVVVGGGVVDGVCTPLMDNGFNHGFQVVQDFRLQIQNQNMVIESRKKAPTPTAPAFGLSRGWGFQWKTPSRPRVGFKFPTFPKLG